MNYNSEYFFLIDAGASPCVYLKGQADNMAFRLTGEVAQPKFPYNLYRKDSISIHQLSDVLFHKSIINQLEQTESKGYYTVSIEAWKSILQFKL